MSTAKAKAAAAKKKKKNKSTSCVEFRGVHETAVPGNTDGEVTWNNLDQNVLRKIFLDGGFTTAMPASCVCKYWREVGKPIARKLNPIKRRLKKQLDKSKYSYWWYDDYPEEDEEDEEDEEEVNKFIISEKKEITQKKLEDALLLKEGELKQNCKFRAQKRTGGGYFHFYNIRDSVEIMLRPFEYMEDMSTSELLEENWGVWEFASRLFHREERTKINKRLKVYHNKKCIFRRRALMVGFEQLGIPAKFLDSEKYKNVREFIEFGEGHVVGARSKKREIRVRKVLKEMFKEYKGKNLGTSMEESALRFNEVKTTVLNEIEKLENDKALGNRVFQMHSAPKEKTNAPVAAVKKSGKKRIKKEEMSEEELPRPVAKKVKKEEEMVTLLNKTKKKKVSSKTLPRVVSAPSEPSTLPEPKVRMSLRVRRPSAKASAAVAAVALPSSSQQEKTKGAKGKGKGKTKTKGKKRNVK